MKKQGFTLIELLAVIVILAIIALIAIPMISKIIDKTEDSAALRSAELYIDGVNQAIMKANLKDKIRPKECEIQEDGNLICDGEYEIKIEATGTKPSEGTLIIEDRAVKSFTGMILDIYVLATDEKGKIIVTSVKDENEEKEDYIDSLGIKVELLDGLTPIVYSKNNWKVASLKKSWYNYEKQEWANAVILKSGVVKNVGDTIDISNEVQGMFVYIPRYEYKIDGTYGILMNGTAGTSALPGKIDVNFLEKGVTASSGYRIHPAFTFGTTELNGLWVGKFETTGSADDPTVLPSVEALVSILPNTQFSTAQIFKTYLKEADTHMAKNSEWGAVAYLSQSKYGKYGNSNYTGINKQVMINNCSWGTTGIGANEQNGTYTSKTCTTNTYETEKGQAASTTGNIYGIYDMAGGSWEYVMGVLNKTAGSYSGFNFSTLDAKYYDNYTTTNIATACANAICYGHALSETNTWYEDNSTFISSSGPLLIRGGYYNDTSKAGLFAYGYSDGNKYSFYTFRTVLVKS